LVNRISRTQKLTKHLFILTAWKDRHCRSGKQMPLHFFIEGTMDLLEYYNVCMTINFKYGDITRDAQLWNEERKKYNKYLVMSYSTTDHRKIWLKVKKHKMENS